MRTTRVLLTGQNGFIGSHLSKTLKAHGHTVFSLPHRILYDREFTHLIPQTDFIIHLASYGNMHNHTDHDEIFKGNIVATWNLLKATENMNYTSFIYFSSSSVLLPKKTMYSACKAACEKLLSGFDKPSMIVRPSTVIGVGEQKEHLIPQLIRHAHTQEPIDLVLEPTHDFIDVADVAGAALRLMENAHLYNRRVFQVSSGKTHTNQEVLRKVQDIMAINIPYNKVESLRSYDTDKWEVDNSKMLLTGWKAQKTLDDSIEEMVRTYE